jgi:hypothetical protein
MSAETSGLNLSSIRLFDLYTRISNWGNARGKKELKNPPGKIQEFRGSFYIFVGPEAGAVPIALWQPCFW